MTKRRSAARARPNVRNRDASDDLEPRSVLKVGADFYVLASSLASRRTTRVLSDGRSFAVFDASGDILESPLEALGFFHRDTRYLSRFEVRIDGRTPYFLNSYLSDDNVQLRVNLTNPDLYAQGDGIKLARDSIQMEAGWVLSGATLLYRLMVRNYAGAPVTIPIDFLMGVDFRDIFEVRGIQRKRHGEISAPHVGASGVRYAYAGLDGVRRFTDVAFTPSPRALSGGRAAFMLKLHPDECTEFEIRITGGSENDNSSNGRKSPTNFDDALATRKSEVERSGSEWSRFAAGNNRFEALLHRSAADLTSIISNTADNCFIMAGIPWFATLFGRDSLITMLSLLPFNPHIAAQTLRALARMQGTEVDESRDEQPGKIVHEIRAGEMAATGEVPFGRYYGSVDSTPLFLWLLGRYVETTSDLSLADELWPNVMRGLEWIERWGDRDGDGYVEYVRETPRGLANQGWKDSFDAISHANGELARPPIALAEVQGYVYAAYVALSDVAARLGHRDISSRLSERAEKLKAAFVRDFWLDRERTVALALDGDKQPCRVMASNAAHCLATGLLNRDHAGALAERLLADDMFSGWGVRTLSAKERRYNPMSYHNGSVWPHDSAIAAMGLARYENGGAATRILGGLFDASASLASGSLPELFCGFAREQGLGPVPYPVACYPQAWSAASVFLILQATLGLRVLGFDRRLIMDSPVIAPWLDWLRIEKLKVGEAAVSLAVRRAPTGAAMTEVLEKRGSVSVEVRK